MSEVIADILVGIGTLVAVLASLGAVRARSVFRRLHHLTVLTSVATPLIGVGVLFDEVLERWQHVIPWAAAGVVALSGANDAWLSHRASYIPFLATDGYRRFVAENADRLGEPAAAMVYVFEVFDFVHEESLGSMVMSWISRT